MEGLDHVVHVVVRKCKGEVITSCSVNAAVRNLVYTTRGEKRCAAVVDDVIDCLIAAGLAESCVEGLPRKKGRRVRHFRWKPWPVIRMDPASTNLRARLGLEESDFPCG